jgi:molecular chaperone GrpE
MQEKDKKKNEHDLCDNSQNADATAIDEVRDEKQNELHCESPKDEEAVQQVQNDSKDIELEKLREQLEEKTKQCDEYFDMLQRTAAEYDNFRKRTAKEKEVLYSEALGDVIAAFLPVIDNIERALGACSQNNEEDEQSIKEGINLIYRQINDILKKLGVKEIKSVGEVFDPKVHDAVMHIEDESYEDGIVVEEFQKGYIYKDKVIRHSVVKVAN